uniref:Uncharacterized protein n=1 Tax=Colwellia sp. C1 TaxID=1737566 RepID=A0A0P0LXW1_9GAMM|nr:hypothetical protein [Colwellia sp. C1]
MQQRKQFKNPYIGLTKEDFGNSPESEAELLVTEIEQADKKGESLAYLKIDGDFFYNGTYYYADILVPKSHWFDSRDENLRKLWIAVIFNVAYGKCLNAEFDFNKVEDARFGSMKQVLVSELNEQEMAYEKSSRFEMFADIEKAAIRDKAFQTEKYAILAKCLSKVTKH